MSRATLFITSSTLAVLAGLIAASAADFVAPRPAIVPVSALSLPAVSQHNGKIALFGGSIDSYSAYGVQGSFSTPLGHDWGAQVDGLGGSGGGATFWGVGGHLFWRDPARGLVGAYGSWVTWPGLGADVSKIGVEAELYHGPLTFEGLVAAQGGTFSGIAGKAVVAWYPAPNLRLDGGFRYLNGVGSIGTLGIEWQHQTSGLSLFANGSWGSGHTTYLAGARFYLGPEKTLIRRQREDDPPAEQPQDLIPLPQLEEMPPTTCI